MMLCVTTLVDFRFHAKESESSKSTVAQSTANFSKFCSMVSGSATTSAPTGELSSSAQTAWGNIGEACSGVSNYALKEEVKSVKYKDGTYQDFQSIKIILEIVHGYQVIGKATSEAM